MAHQPNRPFESLDWYRDAARRGFAEDARGRDLVQRLTSFAVLRAHISVYVATSVALLAINLLRTPEGIWADTVILAWTVLLLVHAVGVGVLWGLQQWNADDPTEALQMDPSRWRQSPMFAWGAPGDRAPEVQDVPFRVGGATPGEPIPAPPPPAPNWNGWNTEAPQPLPDSERASWSEASAAAWLERRARSGKQAPGEPAPEQKTESDA